ncbi:MAG TPA: FAD-binding oxidoreductase [Actinomycetota bacterium]|nr:FAD-binding oxidoreductase [Actinomycetota bacterium]
MFGTMSRSIPKVALERLRGSLQGDVVLPEDAGYGEARRIWNGAIDKHPAVIARCQTADDVAAAVVFGREQGLEIGVRGGGHGVAGNALSEGGIVVDCSRMRGIRVDPAVRRARVEPGVLLGDLCSATQAFGLAVPSGIVSHTGVAGLTLGGGIGWLMRRFGLTCDNLLAADVVTADGVRVRASEDENPDLLWGLRGGGGNFGVVVSFEFACHAIGPTVLAGPVLWAAEDAEEVLTSYREFAHIEPDELTTISFLRFAPPATWVPSELHGRPVLVIAACHAGALADAERDLAPLRRFGRPLVDAIGPRDLTEYHSFFDASVPHGWGYYWKSHYLRDLTPEAIQVLTESAWKASSKRSYTIMFHMGGAVRDLAPEASAFEDRSAEFSPNINAAWTDPAQPQDVGWTRDLFAALEPASTGRAYVNFMSNDEQGRVASAFGPGKYERLVALKRRYDPENTFRLNANIRPASPPEGGSA